MYRSRGAGAVLWLVAVVLMIGITEPTMASESEPETRVIDSSPSRISPLGCPENYDPVNHLPADGSRIKIISGERDRVVWPAEMEELMTKARSRGAKVVSRLNYAHPFQDVTPEIHRQRMKEVAEFLLSQK